MAQKEFIDYLEVGTKVKCLLYGEGVVLNLDLDPSNDYPIFVDCTGKSVRFSSQGKYDRGQCYPCLFLAETEITPEMIMTERGNIPKHVFKEGDLVWVRSTGENTSLWECRYFSHVMQDGIYECFDSQQKEGDTGSWSECVPYDERPF